MHRRIHCLGGSCCCCRIVLCPSLILVLDFPPLRRSSAAVAQKLGILVMILGWLLSGAIQLMLLHLFLGLLDVSCNAGDVTRRGKACYVDILGIASPPFLYLILGWEGMTESLLRTFKVMKIVSSAVGHCWELPTCKLISSISEILYLYII